MSYPSNFKSIVLPAVCVFVILLGLFSFFNGTSNQFLNQLLLVAIFLALFILAYIFLFKAGSDYWNNIYISVDQRGIIFGPRHAGPFKNIEEFNAGWGFFWSNPFAANPFTKELQFSWEQIQNIQFGKWQKAWNTLFPQRAVSIRNRLGVYYLILHTTSSEYYISLIRRGPFYPAGIEKRFIISAIKKIGKENLISDNLIKL